MSRICWLVVAALVALAGTIGFLASSTSAETVSSLQGHYSRITPVGSGLDGTLLQDGGAVWGGSPMMPLADLDVRQDGAFPLIRISDPSGAAKLTILDPNDVNKKAVFDLVSRQDSWGNAPVGAFRTQVFLELNTIPGLDLSPFAAGGTLDLTTSGVIVDRRTNTATVSESALADFTLTAVPEPISALLALIGGLTGLGWLRLSRRRGPTVTP